MTSSTPETPTTPKASSSISNLRLTTPPILHLPLSITCANLSHHTDPHSTNTPLHLSIGIELEFLIRYKPATYEDAVTLALYSTQHHNKNKIRPTPWQARRETTKIIQQEVIRVLSNETKNQTKTKFLFNPHGVLRNLDPKAWTVKNDGSIDTSTTDPKYSYAGVEITSPVLDYNASSFGILEDFLTCLTRHFECRTNDSCGLHVHIGSRDPRQPNPSPSMGFGLPMLKNLLTLTTRFESQLNSLHPPHRLFDGSSSSVESNPHCAAPSAFFSPPIDPQLTLPALINNCTSIPSLLDLGATDSASAYNFSNLGPTNASSTKSHATIEFRQHEGTLSYDRIYHWVRVCARLVLLSHQWGTRGVPATLSLRAEEEGFGIRELLMKLGMEETARFYQAKQRACEGRDRLFRHDRRLPWGFDVEMDGRVEAERVGEGLVADFEDARLDDL